MTDAITAGSILIEDGTRLPDSLLLESEPYATGWATVRNVRATFEKAILEAGWTFFFMAGEIKTIVFGFDKQKTLRTAVRRLMANVKSQHCNSMEITQVANRSFLKFPYVSVSAHLRHLQKGAALLGQN